MGQIVALPQDPDQQIQPKSMQDLAHLLFSPMVMAPFLRETEITSHLIQGMKTTPTRKATAVVHSQMYRLPLDDSGFRLWTEDARDGTEKVSGEDGEDQMSFTDPLCRILCGGRCTGTCERLPGVE
jgi:hypothetical protein